ncbi:MAG: hypothetical protein JXA13_16685 [Anaerolineales bacterium]|nr:hypothetical protein [Anaerolineales bacterium]
MKKILIMAYSDLSSDPRPNRMINWLKDGYQLTLVGLDAKTEPGMRFVPLKSSAVSLIERLLLLLNLIFKRFETATWSKAMQAVADILAGEQFDLVISHDLVLLPLAFSLKGSGRVLFDAREYYPRQFEDQSKWRVIYRSMYTYLCDRYLSEIDLVITISNSFVDVYKSTYGIDSEAIMSWPVFVDIAPTPVSENQIRIIHHGIVTPSRHIENMIYLMDAIGPGYTLDLMLVGDRGSKVFRELINLAEVRENVNIIPPVPFHEIVEITNQYDIGLFLCAPSNFNLQYALPNKFFEFIQARLVVAIGPNIEMKRMVEKYDCGVVSDDFDPQNLAKKISRLSREQIMHFKQQSHRAARLLNAEKNRERVQEIVQVLTG